jgi:hypothetical protein
MTFDRDFIIDAVAVAVGGVVAYGSAFLLFSF